MSPRPPVLRPPVPTGGTPGRTASSTTASSTTAYPAAGARTAAPLTTGSLTTGSLTTAAATTDAATTDAGDGGPESRERRLRVLATSGSFEPGFRGGGPVRSLANILDTLPEQVDLLLVTRDRDIGTTEPYPGRSGRWVARSRSRIFYLDQRRPGQWLRLWRELRRDRFDLLYVNSLWAPVFTVVPVLAARLRLIRAGTVLVAPRGELAPGALSLKARKKGLFLRWWAPVLRSMDAIWHASTDREAADIRAACPWARVEVNQDQSLLPAEPIPAAAAPPGPARLVFISRISPKKNLELVLRALPLLDGPAELDIYGPVEDAGYWARCRSLIAPLPGTVRVRYRGELAPAGVRAAFSDYDAFVFPTLGENFGHVIAESLSASCPVICPDTTPWTGVLEAGGGWVLREATPAGLADALRRVVAMPPAARLAARRAAGEAYRQWRARSPETNILDQVRRCLRPVGP